MAEDTQVISVTRETGAASQGQHRCGLCNKPFDRRDLRDRHKRRCIQSFAKPRKSKRKSCLSCAASKLGCDLEFPSCTRCVNRDMPCEYISSSDGARKGSTSNSTELHDRTKAPQLFKDGLQISHSATETVSQLAFIDAQIDLSTELLQDLANDTSIFMGDGMDNTAGLSEKIDTPSIHPFEHILQGHSVHESTLIGDHGESSRIHWQHDSTVDQDSVFETTQVFPRHNPESLSGFQPTAHTSASSTSETGSSSNFHSTTWLDGSSTDFSEPPSRLEWIDDSLQHSSAIDPSNDITFDLLGSFGIPSNHSGYILTQDQGNVESNSTVSSWQPVTWTPPISLGVQGSGLVLHSSEPMAGNKTNLNSQCTMEASASPNDHSQPQALFQRLSIPSRERGEKSHSSTSCPFHKMGTDDNLVKILCGYPQLMLRRGIYPPFVHHKLYRCAEGDVLEPLANALCCLSAYNASLPSSKAFVHALMNTERDRLVKTFRVWFNSDIDTLAAVHAMCVYQIIGFFFSPNSEYAKLAELQHMFFLKMTRRLIQQHLRFGDEDEAEDKNWKKWIINETIRRTVFLVNTINSLSCRTQKQNPYYYETLDEDLVLNLPLPAPDSMWKASSAEEWAAARAALGAEGGAKIKLTARMVLGQLRKDGGDSTGGGGSNERSQRGRNRFVKLVNFDDLDEYTRLIITTLNGDT